ncbi:MAG: hypothetical protein IIV99_05125 [Oscillospiraceae bacterium]|nr:hypothetical protein [Oscillospiraceae bacterium]
MKKHLKLLVALAAAVVCSVCLFAFTASAEYLGNDVINLGPTPIDFGVVEHGKEATTTRTVTVYNLLDFEITVSVSEGDGYIADSYLVTVPAEGQTDVNFRLADRAKNVDCTVVFTENVHYQTCEFSLTGTTKHCYPPYESLDSESHSRSCLCGYQDGPHPHSFVCDGQNDSLASEATCTEPAHAYRYCSECGFVDGTQTFAVGDALGHDTEPEISGYDSEHHYRYCPQCQTYVKIPHQFDEYIYNADATCLADGTETAQCTDCPVSHTRTAEGSQKQHTYDETAEWISNIGGHFRVCTKCGTKDEYDHNMSYFVNDHAYVSKATCLSPAQYLLSCSDCGFVDYSSEPGFIGVPAEHLFRDYISNNDASCMENATEIAYCDYGCGETHTREIPDSTVDHHYILYPDGTVEATCTTDAQTMWKCMWCGDSCMKTEAGTATGHSFSDYEIVDEASCMENATEMAYCDVCGETDTREIPDSTVDHHYILYPDGTVKATCTTDAQTMWKCMWCGDSYMKTEAGTATGHSFEEYVYNKDATCTADGTLTAVCSVCKETVTTVAGGSAKGHDYDAAGYCTRCGHDSGVHTPDTGDTSHTYLWFVLTVLSATAFAAVLMLKKRTQN